MKTGAIRNSPKRKRAEKNEQEMSPLFVLVLVKLGLRNLNAGQVLARLRHHIVELTDNADFPDVDPTPAALQLKADKLERAIAEAENRDTLKIEERNILQKEAEEMIHSLAWDIQKKSNGDAPKIHSTGFETRKGKSPLDVPGQVLLLHSKAIGEGKIKLMWQTQGYGKRICYFIEMCTDLTEDNWKEIGKSFNASYTVTKLEPGQQYYFRVYAQNHKGKGERSEISDQRSL